MTVQVTRPGAENAWVASSTSAPNSETRGWRRLSLSAASLCLEMDGILLPVTSVSIQSAQPNTGQMLGSYPHSGTCADGIILLVTSVSVQSAQTNTGQREQTDRTPGLEKQLCLRSPGRRRSPQRGQAGGESGQGFSGRAAKVMAIPQWDTGPHRIS